MGNLFPGVWAMSDDTISKDALVDNLVGDKMLRRLVALEQMAADWNGYGSPPPSPKAIDNARSVCQAASSVGGASDRIVASAEGGVALYWFGTERIDGGAHRRYGWIEAENDGELSALTADRLTDETESWVFSSQEAEQTVKRILEWIAVGP